MEMQTKHWICTDEIDRVLAEANHNSKYDQPVALVWQGNGYVATDERETEHVVAHGSMKSATRMVRFLSVGDRLYAYAEYLPRKKRRLVYAAAQLACFVLFAVVTTGIGLGRMETPFPFEVWMQVVAGIVFAGSSLYQAISQIRKWRARK